MSGFLANIAQVSDANLFSIGKNTENTVSNDSGNFFGSLYKSYLDLYDQTNDFQISAEQLQLDFAAGKTDDMVSVILAQEKAFTSLNFTVQVTNKIIDAYQEIMRIQL